MQIIKNIDHPKCRITVFSWNGKYLMKFERGAVELTYKVSEMDVPSDSELDNFMDEKFYDDVLHQLDVMEDTLRKTSQRYY